MYGYDNPPFIGQVIAVSFSFAPVGWAMCDGSLLKIQDNPTLYSLIGTQYGGDGLTTFALPDMRGRAIICQGQGAGLRNYTLGQAGGEEAVSLTAGEFADHAHTMNGAGSTSSSNPASNVVFGTPATDVQIYANSGGSNELSANTVTQSGGEGLPHENRQPFLTINYIIALQGVVPQRT